MSSEGGRVINNWSLHSALQWTSLSFQWDRIGRWPFPHEQGAVSRAPRADWLWKTGTLGDCGHISTNKFCEAENCAEYSIHNGAGKVRWRELWDAGRLQNLGQDVDAAPDIKINVIYWCLLIHLQRIGRQYELSNLPPPSRSEEICWCLDGVGDVADGDLSRPMCDLGRWWGEVHSYEAAPGKPTRY